METAPILRGRTSSDNPKVYLVNALKAYKGGARKNGMMAGIAKGLSDADIENVAAYYAAATCK